MGHLLCFSSVKRPNGWASLTGDFMEEMIRVLTLLILLLQLAVILRMN
jgi:hypothetical protein